jgi:hypothetical protein
MKFSILPRNFTDTQAVDVTSVREMAEHVTNQKLKGYSGSLFRDDYTKNENFISTELMILDYDNRPDDAPMSLEQALRVFADYKCVIATTRNHRKEKEVGKTVLPVADRFRVILFLSRPIVTAEEVYATGAWVRECFPGADNACQDPARRLYPSLEVRLINETGKLIEPVAPPPKMKRAGERPSVMLQPGERGELGQQTLDFMKNGAVPGTWNSRLYKAARDYHQQGYTKDEFIEQANKIEEPLDGRDLATVDSAFNKPPKHGPRISDSSIFKPAVERWAEDWFNGCRVNLNYKTNAITYRGEKKPAQAVFSRMVLDAKGWAERNPIVDDKGNEKPRSPYSQESLQHCFTLWELGEREKVVQAYREKLEYDPSTSRDLVSQMVRAWTGKADPLDVAVMTHFVWQMKRKLFGMEVEWHMMPILQGKTGGGKTRAIEKLLAPLNEISFKAQSLTVLEDPREAHIFGKFYVVFFDEMGKAEKVDIAALKNKITSEEISYRRLGTNTQCTEPNLATFIGATNPRVVDIIYDPTSARRFWEIVCADKLDHGAVNSIDYLALWKSVDEGAACPVKPYIEEILAHQDRELRAKTLVEQWLEDAIDTTKDSWWKASFAHKTFIEWCEDQNIRNVAITTQKFARQLLGLGLTKVHREAGNFYRMGLKMEAPATFSVVKGGRSAGAADEQEKLKK